MSKGKDSCEKNNAIQKLHWGSRTLESSDIINFSPKRVIFQPSDILSFKHLLISYYLDYLSSKVMDENWWLSNVHSVSNLLTLGVKPFQDFSDINNKWTPPKGDFEIPLEFLSQKISLKFCGVDNGDSLYLMRIEENSDDVHNLGTDILLNMPLIHSDRPTSSILYHELNDVVLRRTIQLPFISRNDVSDVNSSIDQKIIEVTRKLSGLMKIKEEPEFEVLPNVDSDSKRIDHVFSFELDEADNPRTFSGKIKYTTFEVLAEDSVVRVDFSFDITFNKFANTKTQSKGSDQINVMNAVNQFFVSMNELRQVTL